MEKWKRIQRHSRYLWRAKTKYQIHSPFVFEFAEQVLEDKRNFYAFEDLEYLRRQMITNHEQIEKTDYGAGSQKINTKKTTTIAKIAKNNQSHRRVGELLFRLVDWQKPKKMLELGTAFGITTMYQAFGSLHGKMITIEGCEATAAVAKDAFEVEEATNIDLRIGQFDELLPNILKDYKTLDYLFIDGNHRKEPTIKYFEMCLPYIHNDTIFVFDDVRWSSGMNEAWQEIKQHPKVTLTIEVFDVGIVFFRKEQKEKAHFELLPSRMKPLNALFSR